MTTLEKQIEDATATKAQCEARAREAEDALRAADRAYAEQPSDPTWEAREQAQRTLDRVETDRRNAERALAVLEEQQTAAARMTKKQRFAELCSATETTRIDEDAAPLIQSFVDAVVALDRCFGACKAFAAEKGALAIEAQSLAAEIGRPPPPAPAPLARTLAAISVRLFEAGVSADLGSLVQRARNEESLFLNVAHAVGVSQIEALAARDLFARDNITAAKALIAGTLQNQLAEHRAEEQRRTADQRARHDANARAEAEKRAARRGTSGKRSTAEISDVD